MSGTPDLAGFYAAIEQWARMLDVPCSRDKVWPILNAYGDTLAQAVVAFRVATGARHAGELDCRFTMLPSELDPYAVALANDLVAETDHPVGTLISDLRGRFPIDSCGIDFGVTGGFKKTWSFFPAGDLQDLSELADTPSMPRSLAENLDFFERYGLADRASLIGIDYPHRTVNVYLGAAPAECFEAKTMVSMLRDLELPYPSEQMRKLGAQAFGIYVTLRWESSKIERICFAVMTPDPLTLPVPIEPKIERLVTSIPDGAAERRFVYAVTASPAGEYHKLQAYHQWQPQMADLMLLSGGR